ncbi:hypothetical protein NVP1158O_29 [Vibrio phage 1.158.O._10N.261.45.E12]|nr:hypothetical protein NVP1158O_29 [Vibrio phage 1.158.O._10N.261.45.E12]AUR92658.1 hypothetical protein NVP1175O_30 [Vibrio phage 1.175.O._10N.261.55.B3]
MVYVLLGGYDYEGEEVLGIYSTKEIAEDSAEVKKKGYDWISIEEYEIDQ